MNDLQPQTEPAASASLSKKTLLLIAGGVGAAVVLVVIAVMIAGAMRRSGQEQAIVEKKVDQAAQAVAAGVVQCQSSDNKEICENRVVAKAAKAAGAVEACDRLKEDAVVYDNCVLGVARETLDLEACAVTSADDAKAFCADSVTMLIAQRDDNYRGCADIVSDMIRVSCQGSLNDAILINGECAQYGIDQIVCETYATTLQAKASYNVAICASISDEGDRVNCEKQVTELLAEQSAMQAASTDTDGDGLTDAEEVDTYKTDPANPDTDGDGYPDGTEIEGGFNPLGPGTL